MMSNILNRSFRTHRRTHSTPPGRMVTATVTDRIPRNNTLSASGAALNDVPEDEELRSGGRRQSSVALVSATASTTPVPIQDTKVSLAMYATLNASGGALPKNRDWLRTHLLHHMETLDDKEDRDFMDAYLRKCKEHDQHSASTHNLSALTGNVVTFLLAGAITAAASLMRELLLVAANVDTIQARIQREVTDAVGGERKPSWEDRLSTPYTMAFIWEAHRRYPMLPLGVPRRACQDVIIGEYFIPENATVVTNTWALHHDPAIWKDPNKFDPTRFLKSDGSLSQDELQRVIPFSVGRRMCPGEIFASAEIYIYLTSILQKYRIVPISGTNVHVDCKYSDIMKLGRHKMRCIPRTNVTQ